MMTVVTPKRQSLRVKKVSISPSWIICWEQRDPSTEGGALGGAGGDATGEGKQVAEETLNLCRWDCQGLGRVSRRVLREEMSGCNGCRSTYDNSKKREAVFLIKTWSAKFKGY